MKKILLLLLISSVPLMSIAQKRSKKSKKEQTTQSSSENVLIIKITEISAYTVAELNFSVKCIKIVYFSENSSILDLCIPMV